MAVSVGRPRGGWTETAREYQAERAEEEGWARLGTLSREWNCPCKPWECTGYLHESRGMSRRRTAQGTQVTRETRTRITTKARVVMAGGPTGR